MEVQPLLAEHQIEEKSPTSISAIVIQEPQHIMPTPIDYMNSYKGAGLPDAVVPLLGFAFGTITPYVVYVLLETRGSKTTSATETEIVNNLLQVLQGFSLPAILFISEFVLGAIARSKSAKASFSPAAIQAAGMQPFEIVEANRIFQNHIESACIYIPSSLSAVAAGVNANMIVATTLTWFLGRGLYRYGYGQHHNPMWRLVGTFSSLTQSFICLGLFAHAKY
jgi:uncharacterized MAPEG superfamily protein